MRRALLLALLIFPRTACAAFELLPGPCPGTACDYAFGSPKRAVPASGSLQFGGGQPAQAPGIGWAYAAASIRVGRTDFRLETYILHLDTVYTEGVIGLWTTVSPVSLGLRFWRVAWDDLASRRGPALCIAVAPRVAGIAWEAGLEGIARAADDAESAPPKRTYLSACVRAAGGLTGRLAWARSEEGSVIPCMLRWSPMEAVTLAEDIVLPEYRLRSGLLTAVGSVDLGLWYEPVEHLGRRIGLTCGVRLF